MSFKGKTIFITGASRGIGKAIALRLASEGANIIVAAKSTTEDPKLGGTIYSAAKEIEEAGGYSLAVKCDIRDELQIQEAVDKAVDRYTGDIRTVLRDKKIYHTGIARVGDSTTVKFKEPAEFAKAKKEIESMAPELALRDSVVGEETVLTAVMKPETIAKLRESAIEQNMTALRKRVNELGVSEPIVQRSGDDRILIQLAGVQDPARAKDVIGRTASLELRIVDDDIAGFEQYRNSPAPYGLEKMISSKNEVVLVKKQVVITGDKVTDAQPGFDSQTGGATVNVRLDAAGGRAMLQTTRENLKMVFLTSRRRICRTLESVTR